MYSRFQLAKKYLHYFFSSSSGKGHGIHSPFVFDFIKNVLNRKSDDHFFRKIESVRMDLLHDDRVIVVKDHGAGSAIVKKKERRVREIAASSLKSKKYAKLLYSMVSHYQCRSVLELGTSLGITTSYLASGNTRVKVMTCEGADAIAEIARETFRKLDMTNVELIEGDFSDTLSPLLQKMDGVDLAFIDGNHRKAPTLDYFQQLKKHAGPHSILVFDDIHWSPEMESAWEVIRLDPAVTLSIDLFFLGIVFFNTDINHKQQYAIRF